MSTKSIYRNLLLTGLFLQPCMGLAQGLDIEPNNPCPIAQDVGIVSLPFTLTGNLETIVSVPDIDFFRFNGTPGDLVRVDHQGATTGAGTLTDPLLGLFDADCNLITLNDDSGSLDSRLAFSVPDNGIYVLAATSFPDFGFAGIGEGSYRLTVSRLEAGDSIRGRLVNARDGMPLPGDFPIGAYVQLFRCTDGSCFEFVQFQLADSNGTFRFETDFSGNPLLTGTYQIQASANGFEFLATDIFELSENQLLDLGDIALTPFSLIGSVSGRLVDAADGQPLPGSAPPFAVAVLERCDEFGCNGVAAMQADDQGRFRIEGILNLVAPGTFRLIAFAEDYQPTTTGQFDVDEFEDVVRGDIALTGTPIRFGAIEVCEIPPGGGICEYGIELRNRSPKRFRGQAWSTVDFLRNAFPYRGSRFQVGRGGISHPTPERLNLRAGQSVTLRFQLDVPGDLPDFSTICASATVGTDPDAQFRNFGDRFLFCIVTQSGQFELLSDKQGHKRMREFKQRLVR